MLVSAALISVIGELYGDQFQALVLAGQPERLGNGAAGCRTASGSAGKTSGPTAASCCSTAPMPWWSGPIGLEERGEVPLILVDAAERAVDIPVLQFLWLAFAASAG